ncbi:lipopolysaccharide heptosyltransferase II [Actimicrobium antarcticum]|uniref:lipopolysaccharide heptosyltransferase II n=2 Tax=Actimicrobium antarcticum TaxID=1051899 RepID=A0ABP7SKI3_9BURK
MRTLVISPNWIGDAVMAQPLLQLLRQAHPDRPIDVLAPAWVAPVWYAMAEVDSVIETPFRHGALQLRERWTFARQLRQRGYADAYVLPNTLKFALIPWLAGIPQRVGYVGEMRYGLLNVVHRQDKLAPRPMVAFYAALANPPATVVPLPAQLPRPTLMVDETSRTATFQQSGLASDRPLVVFAPGAEFGAAKRWPITHFAELARLLEEAVPDVQIVILGSKKDLPIGDAIVTLSPATNNLAGATPLRDAIAIIAQADAVISNDSGLLHIASALNRKIVALYGPTDPNHAPPFSDVSRSLSLGLECAPCRQRECPLGHHRCMKDMSAEMVMGALREMDGGG